MDLKTLNKAFKNTHFMCHILCEMAFSHFELKLLPKALKEAVNCKSVNVTDAPDEREYKQCDFSVHVLSFFCVCRNWLKLRGSSPH